MTQTAAGTRRRVVVPAPDVVQVVTEPVPDLRPGEALLALRVSGVCGTDKAAAHGEHPFVGLPYHPGHEVVGDVLALAPGAGGVAVGDRVTVLPTLYCGACKPCRTGRENLCEHLEFFGCGWREGGMADVFAVPADRLHPVPEGFSDARAALIEPLATPVHAVRLAGDLTGLAVAVQGCGTIGLLTLLAVRHAGARRVVVTDPLAAKRDLAVRLGADAALDPATDDLAGAVRRELGESADVVFDCVSTEATLATAVALALRGGTVVVVGGARRPVVVDLPQVQELQVRLQGATTYRWEDYVDATALLASGAVDADALVTARFPLSRAAEAFAAIGSGTEVKILVTAEPDRP